jgi:hypothetical protein
MPLPEILGLIFDDENEAKLAEHRLRPEQVEQILDGEYLIVPNRKSRRASILLIGRDHGGLCIAAPLERTYHGGYWRVVTAWPCKWSEGRRL